MKIDRIELFHVAMPLIYPWKTAYGEDAAIHSVLCRMTSGSVDGWGESAPFAAPCYSPEWAGGIFGVNRDWLAPALIGKSLVSGDDLQSQLSLYKGNPFAKAVLDIFDDRPVFIRHLDSLFLGDLHGDFTSPLREVR